MSKGGGAGKVYFVLYLAVVLELLIIIVERDEAEEGLLKKQKESMKIVESILSQMQAGGGTEGINTRPQDEITILDKADEKALGDNIQIKASRKYTVEVGVTDVSNDLKRQEGESSGDYNIRLKKLVELANVDEMEYQIFYNNSTDPNNSPMFATDDEIAKKGIKFSSYTPGQTITGSDGSTWEFMSLKKLKLDKDATYNGLDLANLSAETIRPVYSAAGGLTIGPSFIPQGMPEDSSFFYSVEKSLEMVKLTGGSLKKRAFVVNFQPPSKAGYYKLRFASKTNRILGVRGDSRPEDVNDETKVNIGTVQLTVGALQKVKKELVAKLEKFSLPSYDLLAKDGKIDEFEAQLKVAKDVANKEAGEDAVETKGKIDLYGYICKLLAPGQSSNFSQNRGAIEFNIRVITPKPKTAEPTVIPPQTDVACFDKIPAVFDFTISPFQGEGANVVTGRVMDKVGNVVARVDCKALDLISTAVAKPAPGGRREYRGTIDKVLSPGEYDVFLTHNLSGKQKEEKVHMTIFPTSLTEASSQEIDAYMGSKTLYGNYLTIKAIPTSGGKIRSENFRIDLKTDKDTQKDAFVGLSMSSTERVYLPADAQRASLKVWWIQPGTGQIVELYPEKSWDIRQAPAKVLTDNLQTIGTGNRRKIKVTIKNITLLEPGIGLENDATKKASVKVKVSDAKSEISGFEINGDPQIEGPDDGKYTVTLDMAGQMARGEDQIMGTVSFLLSASATNPINGKSTDNKKRVSVTVQFEPDKEGRGGAGGGNRPAPRQQPAPQPRRR
jgi:hypothetical protein